MCVGHGARDLAYAVTTALPVEDRRAWEDQLLTRYADAVDLPEAQVRAQFRTQLVGALTMWTPTLSKPAGLPDIQPRPTSLEVIRRITIARGDHGF